MAPSIGNFWRRGWRMTNGLACRPITKLSVAARVPWSVACVSWAPRARIHIHNLRRRKQSLSCPSSMLLTGERSATCPESVSVRRDPCPAAFFTGNTMQVGVDLHDDVIFFVSCEMLQCMQNASMAFDTTDSTWYFLTEAHVYNGWSLN